MSRTAANSQGAATRAAAVHGWRDALLAVVAGFAAMIVTASLGLWAAGAADLPEGAFPRVVAAVVVMAAGGSVEVSGGAGFLADADASIVVLPLSVTLAGALAAGYCFVRPLRHRAVATAGELGLRGAQLVLLWLLALAGCAALARQTFGIDVGDNPLGELGELLDASPSVGFRADMGATLGFGLLWILGLLVLALLVSPRAPLPARLVRFHEAVRPAASATVLLLLAYVLVALVIGLVVAATRGHVAETFAVILLGLPNIAWLGFTVGLGGAWEGQVQGPFGLPMPQILDDVLRTPDVSRVDLGTLTEYDGRAWWLLVVAAVLVLGAAVLTAVRSSARVRPWQHALRFGVALALAALAVSLLGNVEARFGLSLLGIGDVDGLGGRVELSPLFWRNVGVALLWGAAAGFLAGLLAPRLRHHGEAPARPPGRGS
ncbi:streptophobe family protein [Streptomyces sp. NPDC101118]|uniref:streptophobe family protein n=1 Tax=Streptomyces sp. NPDC101118 TaxID=3366109 RepID=UPI003819D7E5